MNENRIDSKFRKIWCYMVFFFALVCCGFVFNTSVAEAGAPTLSVTGVGRDGQGKATSFSIYVGYGNEAVKELKYSVDGGSNWTTISNPTSSYSNIYKEDKSACNTAGMSSCEAVILRYGITMPSNVSVSSNKFSVKVWASNKTWVFFIPFGGESEISPSFTYDNKAPSITSLTIKRGDSSSSKLLSVGNKVTFDLTFSEAVTVGSSVAVKFKIGNTEKKASCASSTTKKETISCSYTVESGVNGAISVTGVENIANLKDAYGNGASSSVPASSTDLTVDGVKPTISNIRVISAAGSYSNEKEIGMEVVFNENLYVNTSAADLVMNVKFGDGGENRQCSVVAFDNAKTITFTCLPNLKDQGKLIFVSLQNADRYHDQAGNTLNLSYSQTSFDSIKADNDLPEMTGVTLDASACKFYSGNYYCTEGNQIKVKFAFNMAITYSPATANATIKFGDGATISPANKSFDSTEKVLQFIFTTTNISTGKLFLEYDITFTGSNGKSNTSKSTKSDANIYADNGVPSVSFENYTINDVASEGNEIYTSAKSVVKFTFNINEVSEVKFDKTKIYLIDENGGKWNACELCDVTKLDVVKDDKKIYVTLTIANKQISSKFSVKIEKDALSDSFGYTLADDIVSALYTLDTKAPTYSAEVSFPTYKGAAQGDGSVALISGNQVDIILTSEDKDLAKYCVVADRTTECEYLDMALVSKKYTINYSFDKDKNGEYTLFVKVQDRAGNETIKEIKFKVVEMFKYSNGIGVTAKNHAITFDSSSFSDGTLLKYAWFKAGNSINFNNAQVISKQEDAIVINGEANFNGNYHVCVNDTAANNTFCSDFVNFDTKLDSFAVTGVDGWSNANLVAEITFNDSSAITCVAVGKNVSNVNCDVTGNSNVTIYRGAQVVSPLTSYQVTENGTYYFYIKDAVGNEATITKVVTTIDKDPIEIVLYNGNETTSTNLDVSTYKASHKILATFDKDAVGGSNHVMYKYFFTKSSVNANNLDNFNAYYLTSSYKQEITNCNKSINIETPNINGIWNLHIMAVDQANNTSFKSVTSIKVDSTGPVIKLYDSSNNEVGGGSSTYMAVFDYKIVITDQHSNLNLNNISYKWTNKAGETLIEEVYASCDFSYTICTILGSEISLDAAFSPTDKYRFIVTAYDNAGNKGEFISGEFMIDKTAPTIVINVDEDKWYENGNVSFVVSKANASTLSEIKYCLNDCLDGNDNYNLEKFKYVSVTGNRVEKQLNLALNSGENTLYVYAIDVFGNYAYESAIIKYDAEDSVITVKNINDNAVVDLTGTKDLKIEFTISDSVSGIKDYCVFYNDDLSTKECSVDLNVKEYNGTYTVDKNGKYTIEVRDYSDNVVSYNVNIIGIDTEPINFELTTGLASGQFVKGNVTITVDKMRKFMVEDVSDRVYKIDYVSLAYDYVITNNADEFAGAYTSVFNKDTDARLITSFSVSENKQYLVRVIDTVGNISYKAIKINCIDNDNPYIDESEYANKTPRINVTTTTGLNIIKFVSPDGENVVYKYSNEVIKVVFGSDSLRDSFTGYNSYMALKVCFDAGECVYNTYNVVSNASSGYLINEELVIDAPYNFSGAIRYYLVDAASNQSAIHTINVQYQTEIEEITGTIKDSFGNDVNEENKYNKVTVSLSGAEVEDIISAAGIKYALVQSSSNLYTEFANLRSGQLNGFLSKYSFANVATKAFDVTKAGVDDSYYLWIYVNDLLNNSKLLKIGNAINIDTINPEFSEIGLAIDRITNSKYDLTINSPISGYDLYIDVNDDGVYETVTSNKYSFEVTAYDYVELKLIDEAGNVTMSQYDLSAIESDVYARIYQEGNERIATLVIYNLPLASSVNVKYILTNVNSGLVYDESTIDDKVLVPTCSGYEDTCQSSINSSISHGVYRLDLTSLNKDKKVIFYIRVDGVLIDLVEKNIVIDKTAPVVTFDEGNPDVISTKNGAYVLKVNVEENNISNLANIKYLLTTNSNVTSFNSIYSACSTTNCARGVYNLDSTLLGQITIDSIEDKFNRLNTGNYYLYTYLEDDYGNGVVAKSAMLYVDNDNPIVEYSVKGENGAYNNFALIDGKVYVGGAAKLKFTDNNKVKYFEIYENESLVTKCYMDANDGTSTNCIRNGSSETGLVVESSVAYYYLDTGNYDIVAYDYVGNNYEASISIDGSDPIINLYKDQINQNSAVKLYNNLNGLTVSINDSNFNYLTIDLENTTTGQVVPTAARYSYNSSLGKCLTDTNECAYGARLVDMIVGNTIQYNLITINTFDKAGRNASIQINYDNITPVIWVVDVGEKINVGGITYDVGANHTIEVEIGTNKQLTLDALLSKVILDVDGKSYLQVSSDVLFSKTINRNGNVFTDDVFAFVGNYTIEIKYSDEASNAAESRVINIIVKDSISPEFKEVDDLSGVEVQEEIEISGIIATDNYGFVGGEKEMVLALNSASCMVEINGVPTVCTDQVVKGTGNNYTFTVMGKYTFVYTISDVSLNSSSYVQIINVVDTTGPNMTSSMGGKTSFELKFKDRNNGQLNIDSLTIRYPNSNDVGDNQDRDVSYLGLYALNAMGEKYKVDDTYLVSDVSNVLTYLFDKVGTYYLRFSSIDSSDNVSVFEYEVVVIDDIAPVITVDDSDNILKFGLEDEFNVEDIIEAYVTAEDNYDSNILVSYQVNYDENHSYAIILLAKDSSGNETQSTIYIDIEDYTAPVTGELNLVESTNLNNVEFTIIGGSDNSINWWHEYNIQGGVWNKYEEGSTLEFGEGLNGTYKVCVRAVDLGGNVSASQSCKNIVVDTKAPIVTGVNDGDISEVTLGVTVSDERLASVEVWLNDELLTLDLQAMPFVFDALGSYRIIALDEFGNRTEVNFMINNDEYVGVINDINSEEYSITSIEFDKRLLTKIEVSYDENGYANYYTKLKNINVNANDMIYILGAVPESDGMFVIFSVNGGNLGNYQNGVSLIGNNTYFREGVANEDFFIKFGDSYYAYVIVKENEYSEPVSGSADDEENAGNSKLLSTALIAVGSVTVLMIGYQIIKLRKKVRAA